MKKSKKVEEKVCSEEGEKDDDDEHSYSKDEEVDTLVAVCRELGRELAEEFSKAAKKQGMY